MRPASISGYTVFAMIPGSNHIFIMASMVGLCVNTQQ